MPKDRHRIISLVALIAMTLALTPQTTRAHTASVDDAADPLQPVDIAEVVVAHTDAGRFAYRIETFGAFPRRAAPCLLVRAGRPVAAAYRICGDGRIIDERSGDTGERAGVVRPDSSSITYTFTRRAIGDPSWHRWRVVITENRCPDAICDAAPELGWAMHAATMRYETWASRFLEEMQVPTCRDNLVVMLAWQANENTQAVFNPLATTRELPGSWDFNSVGVQNFVSLGQGLDASRFTIENGYSIYGYGAIVRRLERCASPMATATAIRDSRWCFGCSGGAYVTGIVPSVLSDYRTYADRQIATAPS